MVSGISYSSRPSRIRDNSELHARRLFAICCKSLESRPEAVGKKRKAVAISPDLAERYEGVMNTDNYRARLLAAECYKPEPHEAQAVQNLIRHREILCYYAHKMAECDVDLVVAEATAKYLQRFLKSAQREGNPYGRRVLSKLSRQIEQAKNGQLRAKEMIPTLRAYTQHFKSHREDVEEMIQDCDSPEAESRLSAIASTLAEQIDQLSSPDAPNVIHQDSGRSFFCVPGGMSSADDSHETIYEFGREEDGTYSFSIYNKGDGCSDPSLHGKVSFFYGSGMVGRTCVQIQGLKKEDLQNKRFLRKLLRSKLSLNQTMRDINLELKSYLVDGCGGEVRKSPLEDEWVSLDEKPKLYLSERQRKAAIEMELLQDPDFHPLQHWGTCYESNAQTPEHKIMPNQLRKKLKLHDIHHTLRLLGSDIRYHHELHELALRKIDELQVKIHN